ncbi:MAG: hypothetical protein O2985_06565 [Proteobacteria bacterium]|nr:hypothetical protein [Pseudomonadota bacterium]
MSMILTLFFDWGAALRNSLPGRVQRLMRLFSPMAMAGRFSKPVAA